MAPGAVWRVLFADEIELEAMFLVKQLHKQRPGVLLYELDKYILVDIKDAISMSEEEPNIPSPRGENFNPHEHLTEEEKEAIWRSRDALKGEREAFLGLEHAPPCAQGAWREIWKSGIAFVARGDTFNVNFGPEVHIQLKLADDIESFEPDEEPFSVSRYRDPSESDFKMTVVQVRDVRPGEEMFGSVRLMGESENGYPAWWRFFDFSYLPLTRRDSEEWMLKLSWSLVRRRIG